MSGTDNSKKQPAGLYQQPVLTLEPGTHTAPIRRADVDRIQGQLENLVGPTGDRDYGNVAGSLKALRDQAHQADQGLL